MILRCVSTIICTLLQDNGILRTKKIGKNEAVLPDFLLLVNFVMEKAGIRIKSSYKQQVGNVILPFSTKTGSNVKYYLLK